MGLRRWLDQVLGRSGESRAESADVTAASRKQAEEERATTTLDDVEEGARAARDEATTRDTPMPPPGTS
jgi:hypothetical protein